MPSKKVVVAQEVARAVGAGKAARVETVDFADQHRAKTCLEIDFPILPVNQVATIEGNAGKPIYQMSKWWARRRSSVFRSMLIAAATKAPEEESSASKKVWDTYYANHKREGTFASLKVVDPFMGGGTTLVEASRLGMNATGVDLNPIAWFVVNQEFSQVSSDEVDRLLGDIEAEVRPQIMPYFYCDGPRGEKGKWTHRPSGRVEGHDFEPLSLSKEERKHYSYEGPQAVYTFWAKHGPCQVTGCGHRTPVMKTPVMAIKSLSVKAWNYNCRNCNHAFDIESASPRMAPDAPLCVSPDEAPFALLGPKGDVVCPKCEARSAPVLGKGFNKKVNLSLLVHPEWIVGANNLASDGSPFGGTAQDCTVATRRWDEERAAKIGLLEVRGTLPEQVTCPTTGLTFYTDQRAGTVPKKSHFACQSCGKVQDVLEAVKATGKTAPMAGYAYQAYSPRSAEERRPYDGRFFAAFDQRSAKQYDAAVAEWELRREGDLKDYWPRSELPYAFMTHHLQGGVPNHGFTHWWTMFNPRQLLVHAQLLKAIATVGDHDWSTREFVLGAFQNYLRNQSMFSFWHMKLDKLAPAMSNSNFHPKSNVVEVGVFSPVGYGPWSSTVEVLRKGREWALRPWEVVSAEALKRTHPRIELSGKSEKVYPGDAVGNARLIQGSSTALDTIEAASTDLIITDPPFGGLVHYSELSDYFYVWLRLVLADKYPTIFGPEFSPKSMEVVSNRAREPENPDAFYQRLLTQCWRESHRILKPGGVLAFTFHHSEDEPWVAVLESLFEAGFYLEATYPIRSDETKGEGEFGSKTIEYDIIHVCRKRTEEPRPVSWARMRREVLTDIRHLEATLANHAKAGLPAADLQVIRRGKALEYFSRHYGRVMIEEDRVLTVAEALVGINQLIDEETDAAADVAPTNAEPLTRQFLRIFRGRTSVDRDQIQKYLKGTGIGPDEFESRGWSTSRSKQFHVVDALEFATKWKGRQRRNLTSDYDQAWFMIGACHEGSGINAAEQLRNDNFKPHPALKPLLDWLSRNGADMSTRRAANRALTIYNGWADAHRDVVSRQLELFG
ncbi:DUF1156 domain-containing protein [Methylorubrum thiocyanatum]|uniref:DUF1156 domain-containing protein n=1 Tax=Methylorubrum thiocyanatum TaxID=47958 RepID=UPI0035C7B2D7